ncbi:MAG TPA: M48 family metalloprotease [Methylomirabilota bacterium]|jgi:Zn-dependent protease with chaperone function|nr:M48 family metalloprotease [Methylomirabilota bacterium]
MEVRRLVTVLVLATSAPGCISTPAGTYFAAPTDPATARVAHALQRAAFAAGDDPSRYGFAFVKSPVAAAYSDEDATFYITDGLLRLPAAVVDAALAHEVAHEVLGHVGSRRVLALTLSAGFGALGALAPGAGLLDFVASPLAVRAFSRRQELEADRKAVEILRAMGHRVPRRTLVEALRALDAAGPKPKEHLAGLLSPHPSLEERLTALEPLEPPTPLAGDRLIPSRRPASAGSQPGPSRLP